MDINNDDPRTNVRRTDPETSRQAAEDQSENNAANRVKALLWLYENDRSEGWCDFEIEAAAPERHFGKCYWKRFSELRSEKYGVLAYTITKRVNPDTRQPQGATRISAAGREEVEFAMIL